MGLGLTARLCAGLAAPGARLASVSVGLAPASRKRVVVFALIGARGSGLLPPPRRVDGGHAHPGRDWLVPPGAGMGRIFCRGEVPGQEVMTP